MLQTATMQLWFNVSGHDLARKEKRGGVVRKERQNTWNRTWLLSQYSTHPTWHVEVEQKPLRPINLQGLGGIQSHLVSIL